jgi:serine/threonine protein kinase
VSKQGSLTNFLFQSNRCHCKVPQPAKDAGRQLTARFKGDSNLEKRRIFRAAKLTRVAGSRKQLAETIEEGQVVAGTYKLLDKIGEGGMGSIYKAKHIALGRTCAVKFLNPGLLSRDSFERFQEEAKISASLNHPSICTIYDLGLHQGILPYYAMDFIKGSNLEEVVHRHGPLSCGAALELYAEICEALAYAHRRSIIHKDLKPANFMLFHETNGKMGVKILDFGIAEFSDRENQENKESGETVNEVSGSAAYMSPEQFRGEKLDKRADIYSIGASIYETLTGTPPFDYYDYESLEEAHLNEEPETMSERTGLDFPSQVEAIVAKCLKKSPADRYQNASELAIDLRRVLEGKALQFARARTNTGSQPQSQAETGITKKSLTLVFASTLVLFVAPVALFYLLNLSHNNSEKKTTFKTTNALERHITHSPLASEASKFMFGNPSGVEKLAEEFCKQEIKPYRQNDGEDGDRIFVFPKDFTLGDICVLKPGVNAVSHSIPANGTVKLKRDDNIIYKPDDIVFKYKKLYSGFKSGDFAQLCVNESPQAMEPNNLGFLASVKGIKRMVFSDCPDDRGEVAKALKEFKDLRSLEFKTSRIDLSKLKSADLPADINFFGYFDDCPVAAFAPPIAAFKGRKLSGLYIPLTGNDLQTLAQSVSVNNLTLQNLQLNDDYVRNIAKIKGLKKLIVGGLVYRQGLEKTLEKLPSLEGLHIQVLNQMKPNEIASLKAVMMKRAGKDAVLELKSTGLEPDT